MPFWPVRNAPMVESVVVAMVKAAGAALAAVVGVATGVPTAVLVGVAFAAVGVAAADEHATAINATPATRPARDVQREIERIVASSVCLTCRSRFEGPSFKKGSLEVRSGVVAGSRFGRESRPASL